MSGAELHLHSGVEFSNVGAGDAGKPLYTVLLAFLGR
jgi:hypothetical protein